MSENERSKSMAEVIRDQLREDIRNGVLPAGSILRQDALAARFSVSRLPVREALRQLESEGLISNEPRKGAEVIGMSVAQVCDLMEVLVALEARAARLAVPNMSERDLALLEEILQAYDAAQTDAAWALEDRRFHAALMAASNNEPLHRMAISVAMKIEPYLHSKLGVAKSRNRSRKDHRAILDACRAGDGEAVAKLVENHVLEAKKNYLASKRVDIAR
jgi:DNA-binding GntR family transcriptional regulator